MLKLYQFPFSLFCEKAVWALDYKALNYETINLLPGPHRRTTTKLAANSQVPILLDGDRVIQGSDEIITYLDKTSPHPKLTPTAPADASLAHEWERYLDNNIGVPIRACFYFRTLKQPGVAKRFLLQGAPWWGPLLYAMIFGRVRKAILTAYQIDEAGASAAEERLFATLDRLEQHLERRRFIAGGRFSRADLTASALLSGVWRRSDEFLEPIRDLSDRLRAHAAFDWAHDIYKEYRY